MSDISVGILTISDRSARGEREDVCGPVLAKSVRERGWRVVETAIVPDEIDAITRRLKDWSDRPEAVDVVLTSGGTGLGRRDVTPEATRAVLDREVPGLAEKIRREGEKSVATAILSRSVCGTRKFTLILNLPGSPRGAEESFQCVADLIPHALDILRGGDHPLAPKES